MDAHEPVDGFGVWDLPADGDGLEVGDSFPDSVGDLLALLGDCRELAQLHAADGGGQVVAVEIEAGSENAGSVGVERFAPVRKPLDTPVEVLVLREYDASLSGRGVVLAAHG